MRISDSILGAALVIFAIVLAGYSRTFPDIPGQQYGAALFPTLVALGLGGCGAVLLYEGWGSGAPALSRSEWSRRPHVGWLLVAAIVLMGLYIALADWIGFLPIMFLFLMGMLALFRVRWWIALITAVVSTIVIQIIFSDLLLVPLPLGLMPRLPW